MIYQENIFFVNFSAGGRGTAKPKQIRPDLFRPDVFSDKILSQRDVFSTVFFRPDFSGQRTVLARNLASKFLTVSFFRPDNVQCGAFLAGKLSGQNFWPGEFCLERGEGRKITLLTYPLVFENFLWSRNGSPWEVLEQSHNDSAPKFHEEPILKSNRP